MIGLKEDDLKGRNLTQIKYKGKTACKEYDSLKENNYNRNLIENATSEIKNNSQ